MRHDNLLVLVITPYISRIKIYKTIFSVSDFLAFINKDFSY
jgi:hypothetical protein